MTRGLKLSKTKLRTIDLTMRLIRGSKMLKIRLKRIGLILKPTKECKQLRMMMIMRIHFMQMSINSLRLLN